jgi:hypothetical protein
MPRPYSRLFVACPPWRVHSWLTAMQIKPPMHANRHESLLQREVYAVVGCVIEVLNVRGHGLSEGQLIL